jgi:hypothetical protein
LVEFGAQTGSKNGFQIPGKKNGGAKEWSLCEYLDGSRLVGASIPEAPTAAWFAGGIIERRKLEEYLLSPTHSDGRNKLRLWHSVFGIGEGDAELLERLIREHLLQARPQERPSKVVREPERVIRQWQLLIPNFRGPNGNEGPVKTGWAFDPGSSAGEARPDLTNAYPDV